jgi:uncharacterized membrane protein YhaH (DUF805 family)
MTTSSNPYAAPNAAVADSHPGSEEVGKLNFWSARGRIGRLRYVAWGTGAYLVLVVLMALLPAVLGPSARDLGAVVVALLALPMLVLWIFWAIQRAHDLDRSGWQVLLMLIPVLGMIWGFIWVFGRGTPHTNRYGPPPPPNSLGVKILGTVMPVIFVVGIVAAIALPAYVDYTKRAQAAQASR